MSERTIQLWDLPTRLFHWLLVIAVVGAITTAKLGGGWMVWHERFGLSVFSLIVFRICWGICGSTYVRFWQFVPGPGRLLNHLRGRWAGVGHNPLGALSVLALLGLFGFQATTGLFAYDDIAFRGPLNRTVSGSTGNMLTGWHLRTEWWMYGLMALHIAAVLFYTLVKKDNLIGPMITGLKSRVNDEAKDARGGGLIALLISLAITAGALWVASGGLVPPPPPPAPSLGW